MTPHPADGIRHTGESGIALILALLVSGFLSAIGLGLALVVSLDQIVGGHYRDAVAMLHAADAGVELAAHDLAQQADWDAVLSGLVQADFADGAPAGDRAIPGGGTVSLTAETNRINCGTVVACTDQQMAAISRDRPWGANNPRWRLYAYGSLTGLDPLVRSALCYLLVWLADDSRESDGDPTRDGAAADRRGRGILRVRAETIARSGARRAVEAELARVCWPEAGGERCQPGIRVQSWREVRQIVP